MYDLKSSVSGVNKIIPKVLSECNLHCSDDLLAS